MEKNTVVTEDNKVKEPKTPKQKVFFVLKIVGNVLFYALLLLLFLWSIMNINGGARNQGFPNIFGRGFLNVLTDSMSHEDMVNDIYKKYPEYKDYEIQGIEKGDLITSKVLSESDIQELKVGDVCTFYDSNLNALNTHRIIVITKDSGGKIDKIIFQGDKSVASYGKYDTLSNEEKNELQGKKEVQIFGASDLTYIKGKTTGVSSGAGKVLQNLQDNWLWYFVFPVVILLLVEVFLVIRNIMILRGEKNKAELAEDKEAILADEKERMRQELLAELRAQGLAPAETPAEPAKVEEPVQEEVTPAVVTEEAQEEKLDAEVEEKAEEPIQEEATPEVVEESKEEQPTEVEPEKEAEVEEKVEEPAQEETTEEAPTEEVAQEEPVQEEVNEPEVEETPVENKEEVQEEPKEEATPEVEAEPEVKEEAPKKAPAKKKTTSTTGAKKTTTKKAATDKPKATTKTAAKKTTTKKETK